MQIQIIFVYNCLITPQNIKYGKIENLVAQYLSQSDLLILFPFNQVFKLLIKGPEIYTLIYPIKQLVLVRDNNV